MTDITVPPEALEAAAKELYEVDPYIDEDDDVIPWEELYMIDKEKYLDFALSACLAMLKAWPGIITKPATPDGQWTHNATIWAHIILPLPMENTNAES
jgi:hypothetical protein